MEARDERAEIDLRDHEHDEARGGDADPPRHRRLRAVRAAQPVGRHHQRRIDEAGERQVERQPVLRDDDALRQSRRHHPPADRALDRAERKDAEERAGEPAVDQAAPQEEQERQQEHGAEQRGRAAGGSTPTRRWS